MLAAGTIEPAISEWAANVVLARKKEGTKEGTVECLDALSGGAWFSTLDLRSGYHQVAVDPKDADKTAFFTRRGIFRWKVMPFELCNAPRTFQRLMDMFFPVSILRFVWSS